MYCIQQQVVKLVYHSENHSMLTWLIPLCITKVLPVVGCGRLLANATKKAMEPTMSTVWGVLRLPVTTYMGLTCEPLTVTASTAHTDSKCPHTNSKPLWYRAAHNVTGSLKSTCVNCVSCVRILRWSCHRVVNYSQPLIGLWYTLESLRSRSWSYKHQV